MPVIAGFLPLHLLDYAVCATGTPPGPQRLDSHTLGRRDDGHQKQILSAYRL
jgi:hypothetical protein